jgi:hypothetical protein
MAQNGTSNPNSGQESLSLGATLLKSLSSMGVGMPVGTGIAGTPTLPAKNYKTGKGKAAKAEGGVVQDVKARRAIFDDLNKELNMSSNKKTHWAERAKSDSRIKVFDKKTGDDKSKSGKISGGDIIEVQSQKYGAVKIQAGGDGEINGKDDLILAMGTKTAVNSMARGLKQMNTASANRNATTINTNAAAEEALPLNTTMGRQLVLSQAGTGPKDPSLPSTVSSTSPYFSDAQLNSLMAALMYLIFTRPESLENRSGLLNNQIQFAL